MPFLMASSLERGRLGDRARQCHEPLLQVGLRDRHPSPVDIFTGARHALDQVAAAFALGLDLVHDVDFRLGQLAVPDDLAVLVVHGYALFSSASRIGEAAELPISFLAWRYTS